MTASTRIQKIQLIFREMRSEFERTQLLMVASSLAYTTILSIVPLLAMSFAIFQAFGGLNKLSATLEPLILSNLAEGSGAEVREKLRGFIANARGSAFGVGGFLGLLVTSVSMLSSAERAINQIWGIKKQRSVFQRFSAYWLIITLGPMALSIAVGAMSTSKEFMSDFSLPQIVPSGAGFFLLSTLILAGIYKWVPQVKVRWKYALTSGAVAASLFALAQSGYRLYTAKVLTYSKIYGSLAAIPILLLWIYIVWLILLSCAALTAALQKYREGGEGTA